ncbi:sodium:proton antiporter [Woeseia oceani]|uniref:Sodium:proton antiporter n=1 Tax=Woeseia oceani TaxID=1548547 RepID=A0A193LKN3_9GAMM|nr:sodium:proton antiporter [Woeseia oceani]
MARAGSSPPFLFILAALLVSVWISSSVNPTWVEQKTTYNVEVADDGSLTYRYKGQSTRIDDVVPYEQSPLRQSELDKLTEAPGLERQWVSETLASGGDTAVRYSLLEARFHFGVWSLLPALAAIVLCLITKEALLSLFIGTVIGAFMLGRFDITDAVLIPSLASTSAASVLLLYLWLVGGLLGIWSRTGAAQAFAEFMTRHFVKGPRTAKFVCWMMGVLFFQGGTISVVLVGTIVKPVADKERISHEELAYIVDSTASPIASLIAFNAWPAYVQALIFVPGVSFLATENDRIRFFFDSIPFSFYSLFAVLGTLLLSFGVMHVAGPGLRRARERARSTGELDAPGALPLSAKEIQIPDIPEGYRPGLSEFFLPLILLISIAVGTFVYTGTPRVNWGFGAALMSAICLALFNGMSLRNVIEGLGSGLKGVVLASVILLMAVTIGGISQEVGAGIYLVELLGDQISYWMLPVALQLITMVIAFSAGTSWGTYAIAFPLAMPLAWAVAINSGVSDPALFMSICFATVLNGSVYGDQCSPISDTTVLSAMTTGCDLMDHVTTQIVPASIAAGLAAILWTVLTIALV